MSDLYRDLLEYLSTKPVINTHSHHLYDEYFDQFDLDKLLRSSYLDWCGVTFSETLESKADFLAKVRYNSYFVWLHKAMQDLFGFSEPLTAGNWDKVSRQVQEAYRDGNRRFGILSERCVYEKSILDAHWAPGSDNGHPDLFAPAYRINKFFYGYSSEARDPGGNVPMPACDIKDIDKYVAFMREEVARRKQTGCVALKCSVAYGRSIDFVEVPKDRAQVAFGHPGYAVTAEDIKAFQDYVFFEICKLAAELGLPLQCHAGSGVLRKTNALWLQEAIEQNPEVRFVVLHCGYPWLDDVCGLLNKYPNVYPDLCWLPILSTSAAQRILDELIEVGTADKVCWGCDTWTAEESYGALLAVRHVLAVVLAGKVETGYLSRDDAEAIAANILSKNARALYRLS